MLTDVINAINEDFASRTPPIPVTVQIGPEFIAENNTYPRIVVLFTADTFGARNTVGPKGRNPISIQTRHAGAEVHVWGSTYDETATLAHQFIVALYRVARGVFELGGARWNNAVTIEYYGREYILNFTAEIPVQETPWPNTPEHSSISANVGAKFPDGHTEGGIDIIIPIPDPQV